MLPVFDGRMLFLDDKGDVLEYLHSRRLSSRKNAVSMACRALYSHSTLQGVSTDERLGLLQGTEYETLPEGFFNGRLFYPTREYSHGVERKKWIVVPATKETTEHVFATVWEQTYEQK